MSDKIVIPDDVMEEFNDNHDPRIIARWMREECAKVAETYAEDIPDADQDVFHDLGKKIRLIGTNL